MASAKVRRKRRISHEQLPLGRASRFARLTGHFPPAADNLESWVSANTANSVGSASPDRLLCIMARRISERIGLVPARRLSDLSGGLDSRCDRLGSTRSAHACTGDDLANSSRAQPDSWRAQADSWRAQADSWRAQADSTAAQGDSSSAQGNSTAPQPDSAAAQATHAGTESVYRTVARKGVSVAKESGQIIGPDALSATRRRSM